MTYNQQIPVHVLEEIKTYIEPPKDKEFTLLDWNFRGKELPYRLFRNRLEGLKMYSAASHNMGPNLYDTLRDSSVKHYNATYKSDAKISHDAFSMAVIDTDVTPQLSNIIDDIDRFLMPSFDEVVEERVQMHETRRLELLGLNPDGGLNMDDFDTGSFDEQVIPEEKSAPIETEEEKTIRLDKMRKNILEKQVKDWRKQQKEIQKDIRYYRTDHLLLQRTTDYLKKDGILMMVLPIPMIDEDISFKLANNYTDIRILFIKDPSDHRELQKAIILGRKIGRSVQNRQLANLIGRTKEIPQARLREKSGYSLEDEAVKADIEANPHRMAFYQTEIMIDNVYGEIERQETPAYKLPIAFSEEVEKFRIGPLTDEEILETITGTRLLPNFEKKYEDMFLEKQSVTPTPLHDGHIVMLLTSGLLNGYVGTGPNQHLVKGTAVKSIQEIQDVDDDGNTQLTEKEFYNIAVTTLNSNGEFTKIM